MAAGARESTSRSSASKLIPSTSVERHPWERQAAAVLRVQTSYGASDSYECRSESGWGPFLGGADQHYRVST